MNSKTASKSYNSLKIIFFLGVVIMPLSIDIFIPSLPKLALHFHVTYGTMETSVLIFLLSGAIVSLINGPIVDVYGEKHLLIISMIIYLCATLGCAISNHFYTIFICRAIQGIGASAMPICIFSIVRNRVKNEKNRTKIISYLMACISASPVFAPFLGSVIDTSLGGWRVTFLFLFVLGSIFLLNIIYNLKETKVKDSKFLIKRVFTNYILLIKNKTYFSYLICNVVIFFALIAYVVSSPYLFITILKLSVEDYGLITIIALAPMILGSLIASKIIKNISTDKIMFYGCLIMLIAGVLLILFAWLSNVTVLTILLPVCIATFSIGAVLPITTAAILEPYKQLSGSAASLSGSCRYFIAALLSSVIGYFYGNNQMFLGIIFVVVGIIILFNLAILLRYKSKTKQVKYA